MKILVAIILVFAFCWFGFFHATSDENLNAAVTSFTAVMMLLIFCGDMLIDYRVLCNKKRPARFIQFSIWVALIGNIVLMLRDLGKYFNLI